MYQSFCGLVQECVKGVWCGQRCVVNIVDGVGIFLTSHVCVVSVDVVCSKFCVVNAMWLK
jgi:hypothetical protein